MACNHHPLRLHRHCNSIPMLTTLTLLLLLPLTATATQIGGNYGGVREREEIIEEERGSGTREVTERFLEAKTSGGPAVGSSPPSCTGKCGTCRPCKPILVRVPPVTISTRPEPYPLVWRCKCGGKLYKP